MFGILAGVRSDLAPPIEDPRGMPDDVSEDIKIFYSDYEGCTTSYYLISELLEAQHHLFTMTGFFDLKDYIQMKETGKAEQWFSKYAIFGHEVISNEEMDRYVEQIAFWDNKKVVTELSWDARYGDFYTDFWERILPEMAKADENPDNIRMVFWFA